MMRVIRRLLMMMMMMTRTRRMLPSHNDRFVTTVLWFAVL